MVPTPQTPPGLLVFMKGAFLVMFVIFGAGMVREGLRAVTNHSYDFSYTERSSWAASGLSGGTASGSTLEYRGGAATLFGVGFAALGVMLLSWAAGLAFSLLERVGLPSSAVVFRLLALASLAGMVVGCVAVFPPWRRHTMTLYFVIAVLVAAVSLPIPSKRRKQVLPAILVAMMGASFIGFPAFPIFAGIFVALAAGSNLLVLSPRLRALAERLPADAD